MVVMNVKVSGRHRERLEEIAAAHRGLPPRIVIAAGLHALAELSKREQVRVILACVEGDPLARRRGPSRSPGRTPRR